MKWITVFVFLSILSFSVICDAEIPIDDFEAYWGTPALQMVWTQDVANAQVTLMQGGAGQGLQAMDIDWQVPGGWANPGDPTNYDTLNYSSVARSFPALDFVAGGAIGMLVKVEAGWDIDKTNYFLIEYTGDQWAQTWIPGPVQLMPWWSPHEYPAVICPDGWDPPAGSAGVTPNTALIHPSDGWQQIVIHDADFVPWGSSLVSFNAMTGIHLQLWSGWVDTTTASGDPKIDGTTTIWPTGPLSGSIDVDNIDFAYIGIPEPTTIALLGLGGLAILKRKR